MQSGQIDICKIAEIILELGVVKIRFCNTLWIDLLVGLDSLKLLRSEIQLVLELLGLRELLDRGTIVHLVLSTDLR